MAVVMSWGMSKLVVTEVVRTAVVGRFVSTIRQVTVICARWRRRWCDDTVATLSIMSRVALRVQDDDAGCRLEAGYLHRWLRVFGGSEI